jgi:dGTP triphosphohydrolase
MPTKVNNRKEVTANVADVAAKVTEETKSAVDSLTNMAFTTTEEMKTLLTSNQEAFKEGFQIWQGFTQAYINFVLEATRQTTGQSLAFRESLDKIVADNFKKAQALSLEERQLAVDATEFWQVQAQAASDYAAKIFTTSSKVMTTTALFSNWAAERVAKMFTTISTN